MSVPRNTVREKLLYEYAKLIADAAIYNRQGVAPVPRAGSRYWSFVTATYRKLVRGEIAPSQILRENKLLVSEAGRCAYCGSSGSDLHWEHLIPLSRGGPDSIDNLVQSCESCNLSKGVRDPIEWYEDERERVPRLVMGKLLKLVYDEHERRGSLEATEYPPGMGLRTAQLVLVFGR